MTALELIQYVSWAVYFLIFIIVAIKAIRHRRRINTDIALFFGASALIIALSTARMAGLIQASIVLNDITTGLLLSLSYLLLRLVDDFAKLPLWLMRSAELVLALLIVGGFIFAPPRPDWLNLLMILYLVVFLSYSAIAFARASRQSNGVTARRMRAISVGSWLLVLLFLLAGVNLWLTGPSEVVLLISNTVSLLSGVSYFFGFATPLVLRRAWQEPELRLFLSQAANLPRLPTTQAIIHELERGAASSLGAPNAVIWLWEEGPEMLVRIADDGAVRTLSPNDDWPVCRAFRRQQPIFEPSVPFEGGSFAALAAPITAGQKRLGSMLVYARHAPIFAEDDLSLIQLLADQAAVILESRALIDEATRVRASEEAARMKDDFLSSAAHDLKTPLTTLVAQTQLLERRAMRDPTAPVDINAIQRLVQEAERLRDLVLELLDAARADQGSLIGKREPTDLVSIARAICLRHQSDHHSCMLDAQEAVIGDYDAHRIAQLIENLVENAVKYSPRGSEICVKVWRERQQAHLTVSDQGIGIPSDDLSLVFDRFYRAGNVNDRQFAGMGLGLFICRGIVEQHGGRIWASSSLNQGSIFHIVLPISQERAINDA